MKLRHNSNDIQSQISDCANGLCDELFQFIQQLVQTPSLPGEEQAVQLCIADKLREMDLTVDILESKKADLQNHPAFCDDGISFNERLNVIGRWHGRLPPSSGKSSSKAALILNGHVDVVSPGNEALWDHSPWGGIIKNGKLYGRGSCDMKSGLACGIFAIKLLKKLGFQPQRDVLIESVIGEESGGVGTLTTLVNGYLADAAIIMEPTRLILCPVQAGALTFRLTISGQAVHACMKKDGISAIEKYYQYFTAIGQLEKERHRSYQNALYEDPMNVAPISIGTIRGGDWHSTVPEEVVAEGRYGVLPGETIPAAKTAFETALKTVTENDPWLRQHPPTLEWIEGQFESGETDLTHPIVKTLAESHQQMLGKTAEFQGVTYGADMRLFTNHGKMPAVLYGPGDVSNAHRVNEFVPLEDVMNCMKTLALTIFRWTNEA